MSGALKSLQAPTSSEPSPVFGSTARQEPCTVAVSFDVGGYQVAGGTDATGPSPAVCGHAPIVTWLLPVSASARRASFPETTVQCNAIGHQQGMDESRYAARSVATDPSYWEGGSDHS